MTSTIKRPTVMPMDGVSKVYYGLSNIGAEAERINITLYLADGGYMIVRIGTKRAELIVDDYREGFSRNTIVSPN